VHQIRDVAECSAPAEAMFVAECVVRQRHADRAACSERSASCPPAFRVSPGTAQQDAPTAALLEHDSFRRRAKPTPAEPGGQDPHVLPFDAKRYLFEAAEAPSRRPPRGVGLLLGVGRRVNIPTPMRSALIGGPRVKSPLRKSLPNVEHMACGRDGNLETRHPEGTKVHWRHSPRGGAEVTSESESDLNEFLLSPRSVPQEPLATPRGPLATPRACAPCNRASLNCVAPISCDSGGVGRSWGPAADDCSPQPGSEPSPRDEPTLARRRPLDGAFDDTDRSQALAAALAQCIEAHFAPCLDYAADKQALGMELAETRRHAAETRQRLTHMEQMLQRLVGDAHSPSSARRHAEGGPALPASIPRLPLLQRCPPSGPPPPPRPGVARRGAGRKSTSAGVGSVDMERQQWKSPNPAAPQENLDLDCRARLRLEQRGVALSSLHCAAGAGLARTQRRGMRRGESFPATSSPLPLRRRLGRARTSTTSTGPMSWHYMEDAEDATTSPARILAAAAAVVVVAACLGFAFTL